MASKCVLRLRQGYEFQRHNVQLEDMEAATAYTNPKPPAVPAEFKELADLIVQEEGWHASDSPTSALELYLKLKDAI